MTYRCGDFKVLREFSVQCYIDKYENLTKLVVFMGCILRIAQREIRKCK